jgi:apolipoprotein N-acyltransferase
MNAKRFFQFLGMGLLSAILLMVSFPFSGGLTWLVFVAWIPLLWIATDLKERKGGAGWFFLLSYFSMLLFNVGTTWWIWNSTATGALLAFGCNSLLMALALTLGFVGFKNKPLPQFLIGIILCWISFEYLHFQWEISWPWLTLGNFFSIRPTWVQWYELTGVLGGSVWILATNALVFYHIHQRSMHTRIIKQVGLGILVPFALSVLLYYVPSEAVDANDSVSVVILQPNIDPYHEKFTRDPAEQLQEMVDMVGKNLSKNSLILGPETALQESFTEDNFGATASYEALKKNLIDSNHAVLIGASTFKIFKKKNSVASRMNENGTFEESYNTSVLFTPETLEFAHKSKLVPGVEKIPFAGIFPFLDAIAIENGGTSGTLGVEKEPKVFTWNQRKIAPVVCYESIYGGFVATQCRKGANIIGIITNDGWWGNTPGHQQHNSFAALRAIENRRYVIRSGNTGISSVWSPKGVCLSQTQYNEKTTLRSTVYVTKRKTLYTLCGDYLGWVSILSLLGWGIVNRVRARK